MFALLVSTGAALADRDGKGGKGGGGGGGAVIAPAERPIRWLLTLVQRRQRSIFVAIEL